MKKLRVATVFSGIGAFEQALKKLNLEHEIVFACDNGEREIGESAEEIKSAIAGLTNEEANAYVKGLYAKTKRPNYVKQTYVANYPISENRWFEDIRFIDGNQFKGKVDIFVGGSPCQSFSDMGKRGGLEDARGTLFYDYARLIKEMEPEVFIYENVPGMLHHDGGRTWDTIYKIFKGLGYKLNVDILNSVNYGIPQNRKRLFVVGFKDKDLKFAFEPAQALERTMFDFLEEKVDAKFYLGQKGFEFVTNPKYIGRARVNQEIIRTEKANQQFNWNGDFVFETLDKVKDRKDVMTRAYVGQWNGKMGVCRQLTHRECFRLMGYPDSFKIVVPNVPAYRQAGNSIVVNVIESVVRAILKTGVFDNA